MLSRSKMLVVVAIAAVVFLTVSGAWVLHRLRRHAPEAQASVISGLVRFPFALPCSSDSRDAGLFYGALQRHDRPAVIKMLSENKVHLIKKGTPVDILDEKPLSIVTIGGNGQASVSCFVPADVLATLERKAYK